MASVQQAQGVAQINHEKENAILSELVKEAQASLQNSSEPPQLQFATVEGRVKNSQLQQINKLKLEKVHNWHGHFEFNPSENIATGAIGSFRHNSDPSPTLPALIGSKAAVIYGTTTIGVPRRGYLLAWYKAQNSDEHKVYVHVGELGKLMKVDWNEIGQKLDASGNHSYAIDHDTRAAATATIENLSIGNLAALVANFSEITVPSQSN